MKVRFSRPVRRELRPGQAGEPLRDVFGRISVTPQDGEQPRRYVPLSRRIRGFCKTEGGGHQQRDVFAGRAQLVVRFTSFVESSRFRERNGQLSSALGGVGAVGLRREVSSEGRDCLGISLQSRESRSAGHIYAVAQLLFAAARLDLVQHLQRQFVLPPAEVSDSEVIRAGWVRRL